MSRTRGLGAALGTLFLWGACSAPQDGGQEGEPNVAPERIAQAREPADNAPTTRLRLGTAQIEIHSDGSISVHANDAERLEVLERLSQVAGFAFRANRDSWGRLSAQLERLPLRDALPQLVGAAEFETQWSFDRASGRHVLTALSVGKPQTALVSDRSRESSSRDAEETAVVSEDLRRILDERPAMGLEPDQLFANLSDPDPRIRMEAAVEVDPEGEAFNRLVELLASDEDPGVRVAATVSLENSDQIAAVNALIAALSDPSPVVVIEVIDSLEFAGDASIVPRLRPLLDHRDPGVREAAIEAIEFLEEPPDES